MFNIRSREENFCQEMDFSLKLLGFKLIVLHALAFFCLTLKNASAGGLTMDMDNFWGLYLQIFTPQFAEDDDDRRRRWEMLCLDIFIHNLKADLGLTSFRRGLNEYSDLTREEVQKYLKGYNCDSYDYYHGNSTNYLKASNVKAPRSLDLRDDNLVTEVKNQGTCGCCWAFSAVGSLEGQHKKKTGNLVSLSEQQLLDCDTNGPDNGCNGGLMTGAFDYIKSVKGEDSEASYPYQGKQGQCNFREDNVVASVTGYVEIPSGDEDALLEAVATVGPIAVAIDSSSDSFTTYKSGIYDEPTCSSTRLDHAVVLIGYGTEDELDYWLVKNSWGETWGIQGYMKMSRNKNNQCGIATQASYPLV
ncbi:cathepsin L [Caerostris darwini]|uniref:Cathepsin L n=1 Tax=Caerostris darwini TaxID=1538125 RepID=A0AAV4TI35_9ARAC|nr:cathepsin L [Caerostris darwini]